MIYTIEWVKKEAEGIASAWNGEDETFSYEDSLYTEDDAHAAKELLDKLEEVEKLISELKL